MKNERKKAVYGVLIGSNSTHGRTYETTSKSALKAAALYGRCEGGELVTVYRLKSGKVISQAQYTPQGGGEYINIWPIFDNVYN